MPPGTGEFVTKPQFSLCNTNQIATDEALCKPFYFDDSSVPATDADPKDHCVQSSSHCQSEIITFGEDNGGTYFLWKAYTEWPPSDQNGLGYMELRSFFIPEGQTDELCSSVDTVVKVDCCEKYTDEYKVVHLELENLEIEYTSLAMGCGEQQTFTARHGCLPYTWTLTSGSGTLTPSEDTLTALYESPTSNENCDNNPTITLTDRCENNADIHLGISCISGWAGYHYVVSIVQTCDMTGCHDIDINPLHIPPLFYGTAYKRENIIYRINCNGTESYFITNYEWFLQYFDGNWGTADLFPDGYSEYWCTCESGGCPPDICYFDKIGTSPTLSGEFYVDSRTDEQKLLGCCPPQLM